MFNPLGQKTTPSQGESTFTTECSWMRIDGIVHPLNPLFETAALQELIVVKPMEGTGDGCQRHEKGRCATSIDSETGWLGYFPGEQFDHRPDRSLERMARIEIPLDRISSGNTCQQHPRMLSGTVAAGDIGQFTAGDDSDSLAAREGRMDPTHYR